MNEDSHILESRIASLKAEIKRKRESLPIKALAWISVILSLGSIALVVGIESRIFLLVATPFFLYGVVLTFGAACLRLNLRDSIATLELQRTPLKK
jgi:hypothetical protein